METNNLQVERVVMAYDMDAVNKERRECLKVFKEMVKEGNQAEFTRP